MTRAYFFDAGHTLLHTVPSVGEVYAREAVALGARVTAEEINAVYPGVFEEIAPRHTAAGVGRAANDEQDAALWRAITGEVHRRVPGLRAVDALAWWERLHEAFGRSDHWTYYPDVVPTLKELRRRGVKVGVISNWSTRLRVISRELGLEELVDFVLISAEFGAGKPDPRIFEAALDRAGVDPEDSLHAGDSVHDDVIGARGVGIRPVFVWRRSGDPHPAEGAEVVRDLRELL